MHIEKRGSKYRVQVHVDNVRRSKTFATKKEATAWGNDQEQDGILARKTLKDALDRYALIAEHHKGAQPDLSRIKHLSAQPFSILSLENITPSKLAEYRDNRLKEVSPSSVRRELIILSAIFNLAVKEWGWLRINPLVTIKKPSPAPARRRGIYQNEIDQILKNLEKIGNGKIVAAMFLFALETAMRLSEITGIDWADLTDKSVILRDTKNGDTRYVPLSQKARDILADRLKSGGIKPFHIAPNLASQVFQRSSVAGVHFHDSRSEAITRLSKKLDVMQLARMIGHRDLKSLMWYYAEKAEDIADRL